jgi:hypothetical protein
VVANTPAYLDLNTAKLEVTVVVEDSAEEKWWRRGRGW